MFRRIAAPLILALGVAGPALAQTALPCRIGPHAKDGHVLLEGIENRRDAGAARTEIRALLRNPWPWPMAVLPGIDLPGVVAADEPTTLPPRGAAAVSLGWVPRGVGPGAVRAAMNLPLCVVMRPDPPAALASDQGGSGHPAVPPRGVEVVRDERPHQVFQRL